jgi:23S rRNA (cytosine1962-C5)-methyltransferase
MPLTIALKPGVEKKVTNFHNLIYRQEIGRMTGKERAGDIVEVRSADGAFLGRGTYVRFGHIPLRILTREDEPIDRAFFERRLGALIARKRALVKDSNAFRWVHGEADGLPGLVIDVFHDVVVVQVRTLGMERLREHWEPLLLPLSGARGLHERSDMKRRKEERLDPVNRTLAGEVPAQIEIFEGPVRYRVDVRHGLKTGFYLDQRDHRAMVREATRPGERVLDLFCYSGGFATAAGVAGAQGRAVDLHDGALELARENLALNGVDGFELAAENAFDHLDAKVIEGKERWDLIVVDPPAIAQDASHQKRLKWAMWRLVHRSLQLLDVGGRVFVFTCSHHLPRDLFHEAVRFAASDAGRHLQVLKETIQPPDHTWSLQIPESLYLRGLLLEVVDIGDVRVKVKPK